MSRLNRLPSAAFEAEERFEHPGSQDVRDAGTDTLTYIRSLVDVVVQLGWVKGQRQLLATEPLHRESSSLGEISSSLAPKYNCAAAPILCKNRLPASIFAYEWGP